jgi:YesN/AraC family two-component response regulator
VKELILLQKGSVTLDSEVDKGTSFLIIIPIQKVDDVEIISPKTKVISSLEMALITNKVQEVLDGNTVNGEKSDKLELLIIEDNYEMRNYIKSCIDDAIYNISEAENGAIGIQKAIKLIPDIIISDVMMPEKDGFEVTQILRQKLETSHIPIVLLTAKSSLESRLEGLEYGVDAYLVKPFSPKELMLIIKNLIENRLLIQRRFGHDLVNKQKEIEVPVVVPHNQKDDFVKAIKVYINENIEDYQLNGESIAKHFSISRMQLHRKLKALTNSSISVFIRNQRLKNAIELMDKTKMNISEIAYETGFSSPAHFSKTFKKEMGKTPSKYLEDKKQA